MIINLNKIEEFLKKNADKDYRKYLRNHKVGKRPIGVRIPKINEITKILVEELKEKSEKDIVGFLNVLWNRKYDEEKMIAIGIFSKLNKRIGFEKSIKIIDNWLNDISDWAKCDILATQGVRNIVRDNPEKVFDLVKKNCNSNNYWKRRFAIVLCVELHRNNYDKKKLLEIIRKLEGDREYYVKKAVNWAKRAIK